MHTGKGKEIDEDESVQGFYPLLYLNPGWSFESLGKHEKAKSCYGLAASPYCEVIQKGFAEGLNRVNSQEEK